MDLETLNKKQRQLIVHSFIYYVYNNNIWPDNKFDIVSKEVAEAMQLPFAVDSVFYDLFKDFDGSTGFHLTTYIGVEAGKSGLVYQNHFRWLAEMLIRYHDSIMPRFP